jgi:hypothetical protein
MQLDGVQLTAVLEGQPQEGDADADGRPPLEVEAVAGRLEPQVRRHCQWWWWLWQRSPPLHVACLVRWRLLALRIQSLEGGVMLGAE